MQTSYDSPKTTSTVFRAADGSVMTPAGFASLLVESAVRDSLLCGQAWPNSAEFAVVYAVKAWPTGFGSDQVEFFDSWDELVAWRKNYAKWESYEGNSLRHIVYEWDLGPSVCHRAVL